MRARPRELTLFAGILAAIAFSFPFQIMVAFEHPPWELGAIFAKIAPLNWVVIWLCLASAALAYRASRWLFPVSALLIFVTVWNNWLIYQLKAPFGPVELTLAVIALMTVHALALHPSSLKVLLNPSARWWLTPKRYRCGIKAVIYPVQGGEMISQTFDLSEGGAFFSARDGVWKNLTLAKTSTDLPVGARCSVKLVFDQTRTLYCHAQIVRRASAAGAYPGGFAVQFSGMDRTERKVLKEYLQTLADPAAAPSPAPAS